MNNRDLDPKNIIYKGEIACEKWDKVKTKFGDGNIERLWIIRNVKVSGKLCDVTELLGYRCYLQRNIFGDVCIKPEDAVTSSEHVYEQCLKKMSNIIKE